MAGIYIHIPFCRKACHYCNFHFSTQTEQIDAFVKALVKEVELQKNYLTHAVETIYFGGGTPSLLADIHLDQILNALHKHFNIAPKHEFTLEANPDDISLDKTKAWAQVGVNRLSIGIQSFEQAALNWMNRAHTTAQSHSAIENAKAAGIHNISTDLIYGTPHLTDEALLKDMGILKDYEIPHISCYLKRITKGEFGEVVGFHVTLIFDCGIVFSMYYLSNSYTLPSQQTVDNIVDREIE